MALEILFFFNGKLLAKMSWKFFRLFFLPKRMCSGASGRKVTRGPVALHFQSLSLLLYFGPLLVISSFL